MSKNRLAPIKCFKCDGALIINAFVWDDELDEVRMAVECISCGTSALVIAKKNTKLEIKYIR